MPSVYLAECPERSMLKIGRTKYLRSRISNLFRTVSGDWKLVDSFEHGSESLLHRQLAQFRHPDMQGREWYADCPEVRAVFANEKRAVLERLRARERAARHELYLARCELKSAKEALARAA